MGKAATKGGERRRCPSALRSVPALVVRALATHGTTTSTDSFELELSASPWHSRPVTGYCPRMSTSSGLLTADYDFDLPHDLIAQSPLAQRDASRLMVVNRGTGT